MAGEHGGSEADALEVIMACANNEGFLGGGQQQWRDEAASGKPGGNYPGRCEQGAGLSCS